MFNPRLVITLIFLFSSIILSIDLCRMFLSNFLYREEGFHRSSYDIGRKSEWISLKLLDGDAVQEASRIGFDQILEFLPLMPFAALHERFYIHCKFSL